MEGNDGQQPEMGVEVQRALAHDGRMQIFEHLQRMRGGAAAEPGELAQAFDMGPRLVEYHLKVLQDAELVVPVDSGRLFTAAVDS